MALPLLEPTLLHTPLAHGWSPEWHVLATGQYQAQKNGSRATARIRLMCNIYKFGRRESLKIPV